MQIDEISKESPVPIKSNKFIQVINKVDSIDQKYSSFLHKTNSLAVDLALIIFAHVFNRAYSTIPILITLLVGALRPNEMLYQLNYRTLQHEPTALERF